MSIETARLILRPFVSSDAERVLDIHSRLEVIRWLGDPPYVPMAGLDAAREVIARWATTPEGGPYDQYLAVEVKDTGVVAGAVMLVGIQNSNYDERQIGWHLHPDSAGRGYATEAARALLDDAFARGLGEIWCDMFPDNVASAAVADRLGLRPLGVVPDPWFEGDGRLYFLTREEWLNQ